MTLTILKDRWLNEIEISITARCTLACSECGFLVPKQPAPWRGDVIEELQVSLRRLKDAGIRIGSLGILGGEPTMDRRLLERAVLGLRALDVADRLEVVSNGLTPQGLSPASLNGIDQLTISVYGYGEDLLDAWRAWMKVAAPSVALVFRHSTEGWDAWTDVPLVAPEVAQGMFDRCWYRRHCVTVERGRIFSCSRIAKQAHDEQGLELVEGVTFAAIASYLNRPDALPDCTRCTPMMGLPTVAPGVQPDDRLTRLEPRALRWLRDAAAGKLSLSLV